MKKLFHSFLLLCFIVMLSEAVLMSLLNQTYAQSPQKFNYQAVVRNSAGTVLQNQLVALQISLLKGSTTGNVVYKETHSATTMLNFLVRR